MGQIATPLGRLVDGEAVPRAIVMRAADQRVMKDPAGIEGADTSCISIGCSSNVLLSFGGRNAIGAMSFERMAARSQAFPLLDFD